MLIATFASEVSRTWSRHRTGLRREVGSYPPPRRIRGAGRPRGSGARRARDAPVGGLNPAHGEDYREAVLGRRGCYVNADAAGAPRAAVVAFEREAMRGAVTDEHQDFLPSASKRSANERAARHFAATVSGVSAASARTTSGAAASIRSASAPSACSTPTRNEAIRNARRVSAETLTRIRAQTEQSARDTSGSATIQAQASPVAGSWQARSSVQPQPSQRSAAVLTSRAAIVAATSRAG